ncbi:hypothetical protein BGX27_002402, partial [Mortierella sp. AM989]
MDNDQGAASRQTASQRLDTQSVHADMLDHSPGHNQSEHLNKLNANTTYEINPTNQIHTQLHEHLSTIPNPYADHLDSVEIQSPPPEPADELSDSEQVQLPPNWSATTNAKGQLYYYNVLTKETSWKLPSVNMATSPTEAVMQPTQQDLGYGYGNMHHASIDDKNNNIEALMHDQEYETEDVGLPEGWSSAQDEVGSRYFFNSSTRETTWDRPMSSELQESNVQTTSPSRPSVEFAPMSPSAPKTTPKRQSSVDESMLQSQLLSLSLSEEELRVLELSQLPPENIQRRGSLRVKLQTISTNATIGKSKDYWVVVYKGFLIFYRDESGMIKNAHSLKSSVEPMNKLKQAKPSGCFDAEKVAVELFVNGLALTKKKNCFYITPGTKVRLLLQDASGEDEKGWVKDIKSSLDNRNSGELSGSEEPYLIQVLKRQTSGGGETSGLKMNKKIEEKEHKSLQKHPLNMEKAILIRNKVAQGIQGTRRKSTPGERLRSPTEESTDPLYNDSHAKQPAAGITPFTAISSRSFSTPKQKSSRDQSKDYSSPLSSKKENDVTHYSSETGLDVGNSSNQSAKAKKFSNISRNFFSKDKDGKEKDKEKEKPKERSKDKFKEKNKELKKEQMYGVSQVFGGLLVVEPGRTIPKVVELCVRTIEARGLSTAGIYRVSGHMASIQNLKKAFNEGSDVDKLIEKEPDVNTIAALLKLYFRELREPLMLFDFYPSFIAAADISEYNEKLYTIKSLVHSLPESNFNTLQYLMMHLGRVQDQYQTTKMDSANLAICFAPNLLRQEVDDITSIINTGKQSSIVDTLIEQRDWIFDPYPEDDEEEALEGVEEGVEEEEKSQDQRYEHQQSEYNSQLEQVQSYQESREGSSNGQAENEMDTTSPPSYVEDNGLDYLAEKQQGDHKDSLSS